ncbi:MAG TPA: hypothetical protein PLK28_02805 [Candidatus Rifleibacterium sp.]|jgi:flagellar biosynthesis protein FlhF|nr:hypothetical protein [Candidatus Rifleibacterium sp.]HPW58747.1 hypothetical protein [Candidatus Rifleibacterium sp.]
MSYQSYDKVVGDTFFEANLKAEIKFGKDNFEVISTRRIKHTIYMGFGHKEQVELTIGIHDPQRATRKLAEAPSRPLPSVEVSMPRTVFSSFSENDRSNEKPLVRTPAAAPAKPATAAVKPVQAVLPVIDRQGLSSYAQIQQQTIKPTHETRGVNGLRSNQEGNSEPHSQKLFPEKGLETEQINDLLSQIQAVKSERTRIDRIANASQGQPQSQARPTAVSNSRQSVAAFSRDHEQDSLPCQHAAPASMPDTARMAKMLADMESRMETLLSALQKMNIDTGKVLERETPDLPKGLYEVKKGLLAMETPVEVADDLVSNLRHQLSSNALRVPDEAIRATTSWLEQKLKFSSEINMRETTGPSIVVLIGPTGVGKTTTIAKLAAAYGLSDKFKNSVALFTMDTYRIGATEQLQHYAQIIDVDMEVLYKPEDVDTALERHFDKSLIIVDTAGRCQKDSQELCELRSFIDRLPSASRYLVLSATTKYVDMLDTIRCFGKVGFEHLIFTKVDETNNVGPLLAVLFKTGKSLAYITNGQKVPDDFRPAGFDFFNNRMFSHL